MSMTGTGMKAAVKTKIEISQNSDFQDPQKFETSDHELELTQLKIGTSFWRISFDGSNWSPVEKFEVVPGFAVNLVPQVRFQNHKIVLNSQKVVTSIDLKTQAEAIGFLTQSSADANFADGSQELSWSKSARIKLQFSKIGQFYYRFRAVNRAQEISNWSEIQSFEVEPQKRLPHKLPAPKIEIARRAIQPEKIIAQVEKPIAASKRNPTATEKASAKARAADADDSVEDR